MSQSPPPATPTNTLGFSAGLDFETRIMVKENAPLKLPLRAFLPQIGCTWAYGATHCYQPAPEPCKCLAVLANFAIRSASLPRITWSHAISFCGSGRPITRGGSSHHAEGGIPQNARRRWRRWRRRACRVVHVAPVTPGPAPRRNPGGAGRRQSRRRRWAARLPCSFFFKQNVPGKGEGIEHPAPCAVANCMIPRCAAGGIFADQISHIFHIARPQSGPGRGWPGFPPPPSAGGRAESGLVFRVLPAMLCSVF